MRFLKQFKVKKITRKIYIRFFYKQCCKALFLRELQFNTRSVFLIPICNNQEQIAGFSKKKITSYSYVPEISKIK